MATCDAVQFSYNGGLFKDVHTISYLNDNIAGTNTDADLTVNSYSLLKAYLAVENIPLLNASIGQTYNRNIIITNSGNGSIQSFIHEVNVFSSLQANYQLSFNSTPLTPVSIIGDIYTYEINLNNVPFLGQIGDGDNEFENETITLSERIVLSDCNYDMVVSHSPRWGVLNKCLLSDGGANTWLCKF